MSITPLDTLECGHTPTADAHPFTTGYATDRETGERMCYPCADADHRATMADTATTITGAYVSSDERHVTTWTGGILGRVIGHSSSRNGWHGSEIHAYRVRVTHDDGTVSEWYGRGAGAGMCLTLRRARKLSY